MATKGVVLLAAIFLLYHCFVDAYIVRDNRKRAQEGPEEQWYVQVPPPFGPRILTILF